MKNHHFWYSKKQEAVYSDLLHKKINYANINGELVKYTTCSETMNHGCLFDDMQYLGQGDYHSSNGYW